MCTAAVTSCHTPSCANKQNLIYTTEKKWREKLYFCHLNNGPRCVHRLRSANKQRSEMSVSTCRLMRPGGRPGSSLIYTLVVFHFTRILMGKQHNRFDFIIPLEQLKRVYARTRKVSEWTSFYSSNVTYSSTHDTSVVKSYAENARLFVREKANFTPSLT